MATSKDALDPETVARLINADLDPYGYKSRTLNAPPYNTAGIPGLLAYDLPVLQGSNTKGFVLPKKSRADPDRMYLDPQDKTNVTVAHEAEHLLADRGLGHPTSINTQFDKLIGDKEARKKFVQAAIESAPYLEQKYGLKNAYFQPAMYKYQGSRAPNLLFEQLASLASIEVSQNVDLTKDPVLRKTLFKNKDVRETYNALTGLRQTRLDPRDLPPYTRLPEPEVSAMDKIKKMLGFAKGGYVENAGNKKLI